LLIERDVLVAALVEIEFVQECYVAVPEAEIAGAIEVADNSMFAFISDIHMPAEAWVRPFSP
jgi:hypothetical protein